MPNCDNGSKINKSVVLQSRRAKTNRSGCCQMAVQGALWLSKRLFLNLNFSFLNRILLLLIQVATQLSSRGWVGPVPDPILPEKVLGYSRESNPGPLGWQSDVLATIPNRWSRVKDARDNLSRDDIQHLYDHLHERVHAFVATRGRCTVFYDSLGTPYSDMCSIWSQFIIMYPYNDKLPGTQFSKQ